MEQLAHNGHVGLHRLLSAFQKVLVIGTDTRLAARADHRREEESSAEMGVAHPRDTSRLGDGGTGLVLPGIEPCMRHPLAGGHILGKRGEFGEDVQRASLGDASNGEEDLESLGEIGVFPDEGDSELLQVSNTPIEMLEMFQDVLAHEGSDFRTALGHVQAILFSGARSQESLESPRDGADLQDSKRRGSPGFEGHAPSEFQEHLGVDGVRLGALQPGSSEISDGTGIDDLNLDSGTVVERPGELEPIDPRGLHADTCEKLPGGEPADQTTVTPGCVGNLEGLGGSPGVLERNGEGLGSHIDPYENGLHLRFLRVYDRFRLPDPKSSPTGLVMQAHRPQKLSGMGEEGRGPI